MRFGHILFLIVAIAIIEMYLLIAIGGEIGALPTIALVFITAATGLWMLRQQGFSTLSRAMMAAQRGEEPITEVAEAPFLLLGGVLLLLPGFFTDAIGFLCLLPWTRRALLRTVLRRHGAGTHHQDIDNKSGATARSRGPQVRVQTHSPRIIEGEWKQED